VIYCEKCTIEVHDFWHPVKANIKWTDGKTETIESQLPQGVGEGYYYECQEVMRCLDAGLKESPLMTLADSIRTMEQLDTIRSGIALKYPFEN
jgi:predicted dehydrogenase